MALYDLVFEGGGAKGAAFGGARVAFSSAGHLPRRIIGTSAGAITATLLGAGYSAKEMLVACTETVPGTDTPVFATFMDAPQKSDFTDDVLQNSQTMQLLQQVHIPLVGDTIKRQMLSALLDIDLYREAFSFNECGGFYAGNAFLSWFRGKLQAKGLDPDIAWSKFAAQTHSDVSVVTSDVTEQEMVVLNSRTAPDCPVALSVRMSMSIPFVWREMIWQNSWGLYRGRSKAGHIFVDGGVLSNFALALVAESGSDIVAIMGNTDPNGAGSLGLLLDENLPVPGAADTAPTRRPRLLSADRVTRLTDAMSGASDATVMRDYPDLICHLPVQGYGTTEFRMSQDKMNLLINAGRDAMDKYLNRLSATAMRNT
jgi:NTE family protein